VFDVNNAFVASVLKRKENIRPSPATQIRESLNYFNDHGGLDFILKDNPITADQILNKSLCWSYKFN